MLFAIPGTVPLHCSRTPPRPRPGSGILRASLKASISRVFSSPFFIAAAALGLRLAILYLSWRRASPTDAGQPYGYETGHIAASIASGKGFSSPLPFFETGPTAWLSPIYPYLVAGIFKLGGIFTVKSHAVIQMMNCLFSAVTIFPIYAIAKRSFGAGVAIFSCWLWVFWPAAWHVPIADIWDTALTALWLAMLFAFTLAMKGECRVATWATYGLLWAIGALINASLLAVMPFLLLWLAWQSRERSLPWFRLSATAALVFVLGIAPWTVRNYQVFGKFIPMRSNFKFELWLGNRPPASDMKSFTATPSLDSSEAIIYAQMGEIAYVESKGQQAVTYIRSHPRRMFQATVARAMNYWFEVTDRPGSSWSQDPSYIKAYTVLNAVFVAFCGLGMFFLWRENQAIAWPFLLVLIFYPAVYYITHPLARYRFPLEPILAVLAAHGLTRAFSSAVARQQAGEGANAVAR
jgi:4-amino-4-deoxy-L-arabinose transferase-like glycosyltransferase